MDVDTIWMWLFVIAPVMLLDVIFYGLAKYPERTGHWWSMWPFSGYYAVIRYGFSDIK